MIISYEELWILLNNDDDAELKTSPSNGNDGKICKVFNCDMGDLMKAIEEE